MPERDAASEASIEALRAADGTLDRTAVRNILPYGDAFLFVDRVTRLADRELEAEFRIPQSAPYLDSHFRGLPIMPGALMSEAFAQAGAILVRHRLQQARDPRPNADIDIVGHHVESARFLKPALPGDLLHFEVALRTMSRHAARLEGRATVGSRQVGKMRVVVAIMTREALLREVAELGAVAQPAEST